MSTIKDPGPNTTGGSITFGDVLFALGTTDCNSTNAGALREKIGRGSTTTVQRHLNEIRAQIAAAASTPASNTAVPPAPAEVMAAVWASAYGAAQVHMLSRMQQVTAERDALNTQVQAQALDVSSLTSEVDSLSEKLVTVTAAHQTVVDESNNTLLKKTDEVGALVVDLVAAKREIAKITLEAQNAAESARKDLIIERQALQSTIDRLLERVSQSRSLEILKATTDTSSTQKLEGQ